MIKRIIPIAILSLMTVAVNAQVVTCTLKSRDHKTDYYSCEDGYSRSYVREDLLKEPNPHKVMYSCFHHEPSGFAFAWTEYNLGIAKAFQNGLFVNKPTSDCNNILSLVKKDGIAREKSDVRRYASRVFDYYIYSVIEYYELSNKINLSWNKIKEDIEDENLRLSANKFNINPSDQRNREYFWKDKKHHEFYMSSIEPQNGNGVTIEIKDDMPNTGCKKGTEITFLIDEDYRIKFPADIKKYACLDSISKEGLRITHEGSDYKIEDGSTFLKNILEGMTAIKNEKAEQDAAEARFKKAWDEAKNTSSKNESIEHSFKMCYGSGWDKTCNNSLSSYYEKRKRMDEFFYMKEKISSEEFDMGTIDLGNVKNKNLEFTIVMNWDELNSWNDRNQWDEEKWGNKDENGICKEMMGKIEMDVGFVSKEKNVVALPIDNYFIDESGSHPWIKRVSIPLEDFTSKTNAEFNWSKVGGIFVGAVYSDSYINCRTGFGRSKLFPILEKNFYDVINVAVINTAPTKKVLDVNPATCSSRKKGAFEKGSINANNTYICTDSGWSLYSVKIGNIEVSAHNLDQGGKKFKYSNTYFEEDNQIEIWNRYSQTWGHIYEKSDLQNVCPNGWRLPNESDIKEIKQQIESNQAVFPYINYSYENNQDEYGCVDMYGNRVRTDTSLCPIASSKTYFSNNTYIMLEGEQSGSQYAHPNLYWAIGNDGKPFVYGVNNFQKKENFVSDMNFIRCVKADNNLGKPARSMKKEVMAVSKQSSNDEIALRKERLKNRGQENLDDEQAKASAAAESAKQNDSDNSMSTTKLLRIGVFSAIAIGGAAAAYMFDKKAKDATATPPTNEAEFKKGHDDAKQNQNVRNISLGVAAAGLVALGLTFLF